MPKRRKDLYFLFQFTLPWVLLTLAFTTIAHLAEAGGGDRSIGSQIVSLFIASLTGLVLFGALFSPIFILARRVAFEPDRPLRNLSIHFAHGTVFLIFQYVVYTFASGSLASGFRDRFPELMPFVKGASLGGISLAVTFYAVTVFAIQSYLARLRDAEEETRMAQLRSDVVEAQLQALKMQIQPHFLFNTLNSISSLVLTNPPQAYQMIAELGDFLRMTLDHGQEQFVTVSEELRFLRSYLAIEQVRFPDRLGVDFDVDPDVLGAAVPHLVLQPIVENSIKHAVSHRRHGGRLAVRAEKVEDKLRMRITDNGGDVGVCSTDPAGGPGDDGRSGTGLANVRNRLEHYYGDAAGFDMTGNEDGGTTVTLTIPLDLDPVRR